MAHFSDDDLFPAVEKAAILADWRQFIRGGFRFADFSQQLYEFLIHRCGSFIAHFNRRGFWEHFFRLADADLIAFLAQFGSAEKLSAEGFGGRAWLDNQSADLVEAMCLEMEAVYDILRRTLDGFAIELYQAERQAALAELLAEMKARYPRHSEADLRAQLADLYDGLRPMDEYVYEVAFKLTDEMRDRLAEALAMRTEQVRHPSVFELRLWLDQAGRPAPEAQVETRAEAQPAETLFTAQSTSERQAGLLDRAEQPGQAASTESTPSLDLEAIKRRLSMAPESEQVLTARRRRLQAPREHETSLRPEEETVATEIARDQEA
jgi:hypothetical protein